MRGIWQLCVFVASDGKRDVGTGCGEGNADSDSRRGGTYRTYPKTWKVFSTPAGKELISVSSDRTIRIWDTATGAGAPHAEQTGYSGSYAAAISPDGKRHANGHSLAEDFRVIALRAPRVANTVR